MVSVHHGVAFVVIATCFVAAATGGWAYFRQTEPRAYLTHLLALAQTLVIAQAAIGLLLLSSHHRAMDRLHYLYGGFAPLSVLSPWVYATPHQPDTPPRVTRAAHVPSEPAVH